MKSRDHLIRLKRFQVEERRRRVAQIETMIAEFSRMAADLDREIATEEQRSGITDPTHFAYPTYARRPVVRRDNLQRSADELKGQIEEARGLFDMRARTNSQGRSLEGRDKDASRRGDQVAPSRHISEARGLARPPRIAAASAAIQVAHAA